MGNNELERRLANPITATKILHYSFPCKRNRIKPPIFNPPIIHAYTYYACMQYNYVTSRNVFFTFLH